MNKLRVAVICAAMIFVFGACGGGGEQASDDIHASSAGSYMDSQIKGPGGTSEDAPPQIADKEMTIIAGSGAKIEDIIAARIEPNIEGIKVNIAGDIDTQEPGEYEVEVTATNEQGVTTSEKVRIELIDPSKTQEDYTFITNKGYDATVKNGVLEIEGTKIVNKTFSLPSSYGSGITNATFEAFEQMASAAAKEGHSLLIKSEYRSYADQKYIYDNYVSKSGREAADKYSARPGHSEHQLGETMDVNSTDETFKDTPEAKWMNDNCYKYGLIIRYPEGKEKESGYIPEAWHLRYVGKELAEKLYNDGEWLTLEEYYGIDSRYRDDEEDADTGNNDGGDVQ